MPNLRPPVVNVDDARAYRDRILSFVPESRKNDFTPLMTLYLTDQTTPQQIRDAKEYDPPLPFSSSPQSLTV
jgi:dihydroorotase